MEATAVVATRVAKGQVREVSTRRPSETQSVSDARAPGAPAQSTDSFHVYSTRSTGHSSTRNSSQQAPRSTFQLDEDVQSAEALVGTEEETFGSFSRTFSLYQSFFSGSFYLGERRHTPFYAVTLMGDRPWSRPLDDGVCVNLHGSEHVHDTKTLPLAAASFSTSLNGFAISLPGEEISPTERVDEWLQTFEDHSKKVSWYRFFLETPSAPPGRRDEFEWRRVSGGQFAKPEPANVGRATLKRRNSTPAMAEGWELVYLSATRPLPPDAVRSEDGYEIVFSWFSIRSTFDTKLATFEFYGSGRTDALGDRWALMAVTAGLCIFVREHRERMIRSGKRRSRSDLTVEKEKRVKAGRRLSDGILSVSSGSVPKERWEVKRVSVNGRPRHVIRRKTLPASLPVEEDVTEQEGEEPDVDEEGNLRRSAEEVDDASTAPTRPMEDTATNAHSQGMQPEATRAVEQPQPAPASEVASPPRTLRRVGKFREEFDEEQHFGDDPVPQTVGRDPNRGPREGAKGRLGMTDKEEVSSISTNDSDSRSRSAPREGVRERAGSAVVSPPLSPPLSPGEDPHRRDDWPLPKGEVPDPT